MLFLEILLFVAGALLVIFTMLSAIRTVVVPRGEQVVLTRTYFWVVRALFRLGSRGVKDYEGKDALLARFAPTALITLPLFWAAGVITGFGYMFWSLGVTPMSDAFALSGSSLTTLGFRSTENFAQLSLAVIEGLIGLGLVALLISYLPSIYNVFREREVLCTLWNVRAGSPPEVGILVKRFHQVGLLDDMDDTWTEWERWFVMSEEVHLSYPALVFFRSPTPYQSWITSAGNVLDTAAFVEAAVDVPPSAQAQLCLRSGYVALRRITDHFNVWYEENPAPTDPISIPRGEFDDMWDELASAGVPLKQDREAAWRDFTGWRVNYDVPLRALCAVVDAPYAKWSSDLDFSNLGLSHNFSSKRQKVNFKRLKQRLARFRSSTIQQASRPSDTQSSDIQSSGTQVSDARPRDATQTDAS